MMAINPTLLKLQLFEKEILQEILKICQNHNLRVFAIYGTLLGAIRHGDFIPWDDDVDVAMPRKDYNLFKEYAREELPENFKIRDATDNVHNGCVFMKVHNIKTAAIHGYTKDKDRYTGIYVDIFPLDGCPEEKNKRKRHVKKVHKWMILNHKLRFGYDRAHSFKGKIAYMFMLPLKLILPFDYFYQRYEKEVQKYLFDNEKWCVADWYEPNEYRYMMTKNFLDISMKSFGDLQVPVPQGYIEVLENQYGDWEKLPKVEDRVGLHNFKVVDFNKSYLEY